jgi:hypothetical protein
VRHHALARLTEDAERHGVPEEAAGVVFGELALLRDLREGGFAVDGDASYDVETVDCVEAYQGVVLLDLYQLISSLAFFPHSSLAGKEGAYEQERTSVHC